MQEEMIYDDAPTFDELIKEMIKLKNEINNLNWRMKTIF